MRDITVSKKIGDKYVAMITLKEGWKLGFSPAFKKELKAWLNAPSEEWLNLNLKEWEAKPGATNAHASAKQDGYQPAQNNLDQEVPF